MKTVNVVSAPVPTIRRLPRYIHVLKRLKSNNVRYVSATVIAKELGIESIQVRKDLSLTGIVGKPKLGFDLDLLLTSIHKFLNWNITECAILIGVGALGSAILGYDNFKNYGLNIISAFDKDKKKVGKKIHGIKILSTDELYSSIEKMQINIAVITTPGNAAQDVTNVLVNAGIKAIWNFSPASLKVPEHIIVESVHLSQSLAVLTHKLAQKN